MRAIAVVASLIVVVSFALFAIDESRDASRASAEAVAGLEASATAAPTARQEQAREAANGSVREAIDDANDVLVKPFAWTVDDVSSTWARRGVPTLLAVVVFGFGLGYVARFAHGRV